MRIKEILEKGEGTTIEFKKARTTLPKNVFETVCAFLNGFGGDLLLGVADNGTVIGIESEHIETMKNQLVTLSNNPNKLDPPFMLFPEEYEIDGRHILYVRIPQSSQVHKTAHMIYDRNEDGDFKVTASQAIGRLYQRKRVVFSENKIYPYLDYSDFNENVFTKVRNLIQSHRPGHPWLGVSNEEMLKLAGLHKRDFETGQSGYTLAAALLFGKDSVIQQIAPHYKTDALLRREDKIHYDDRREIRTNLIDAYDELMQFIRTHLPDKFYMEGDIRVDLREKIFREIVANILIHREYLNAIPARLIIYKNRLETENANNPVGFGPIDPENFSPHPKNPALVKFFQQIGRAEELGSGMRNIRNYLPLYAENSRFELREENNFKTVLYFGPEEIDDIADKVSEKSSEKSSEKILELISKKPDISAKEIAEQIDISARAVEKHIAKFKEQKILKRIGPDKGGYWQVIKK